MIARKVSDPDQQKVWLQYALEHKTTSRQIIAAIEDKQIEGVAHSTLADNSNRKRFDRVFKAVHANKLHIITREDIDSLRQWLDEIEQQLPE